MSRKSAWTSCTIWSRLSDRLLVSGFLLLAFSATSPNVAHAQEIDFGELQSVADIVTVSLQGTRFDRRTGNMQTNALATNVSESH